MKKLNENVINLFSQRQKYHFVSLSFAFYVPKFLESEFG